MRSNRHIGRAVRLFWRRADRQLAKRPRLRWSLKWAQRGLVASALAVGIGVAGFHMLDRAYPLPEQAALDLSTEVQDRDGRLLRAFSTSEGRWRLDANLDAIDPEFIQLLIAYEDQRFWRHHGVDLLAMLRAAGQLIRNGRIVSGGSTITMQLARLMERRPQRSLSAKAWQMFRALQIERRYTKVEILRLYLTLAPYGGNLEGVRAASLAYFGKEPKSLSLGEAALLVALPQSPERRRPDLYPKRAQDARNTVLKRAAGTGTIARSEIARASRTSVRKLRRALPSFAAHLSYQVVKAAPDKGVHRLTIRRSVQERLETVARTRANRFDARVSIAMVLADAKTGEIIAHVGAADPRDHRRAGWIDMTRAVRSPGSTLKPFIYGLALEEGVVRPATMMVDAPSDFSGYRPRNFDLDYQGEISVARALQLSLNVPAVHLLESVGPARLTARMRKAGADVTMPSTEQPGLAIALGGMGITLMDLTQLYTGLVNSGTVMRLKHQRGTDEQGTRKDITQKSISFLRPDVAWQVGHILAGVEGPRTTSRLKIAFKTGTSYGHRDAWSIGFDGRHVLGVWVGRADNGAVPGLMGIKSAAPILFEAFAKSGLPITPFAEPPSGVKLETADKLPAPLKRYQPKGRAVASVALPEPHPRIVFPPNNARLEVFSNDRGDLSPIIMKLQDGRPPFRWLANGKPLQSNARRRTAQWTPDGAGFSTLTVIDAGGRTASVDIYIDRGE